MTWFLTIISLIGNYLNCRKIRISFIVWLICNTGWLIYDLYNRIYSRAILDLVQSGFCIYGYLKWRKEDKNGKNRQTKEKHK